jgi:hypothetical protein
MTSIGLSDIPESFRAFAIAAGEDAPAMHGWRNEVFGKDALRLKRGEIALSAEGGAVKVVPLGAVRAAE